MKKPTAALSLCLSSLACSTAANLNHWIGLWTNRGDRHNLEAELSLSADGRFDLMERVPAQSKPIPNVLLTGTWSLVGGALQLHEKEALVYGFIGPGRKDRPSISPMNLDLDLQIGRDGGTLLLPYHSDTKQKPIYQAVLHKVSRTPKPIDWAELERRSREGPRPAAPQYRALGHVDPRGKVPGLPPKS